MTLPDFSINSPQKQWHRFCELLWFDESLKIWLDVSRMNINAIDLNRFAPLFKKAFDAIDDLESGSIANQDESRQVGHYWLRNSGLAPNKGISDKIEKEIERIHSFANKIINGQLKAPNGKNFTDVLWIGIGGSGLGPLLIVRALEMSGNPLNIHFIDNVDPNGINKILKDIHDSLSTTLFVTVSKSGGTPEPRIAMEQARFRLESIKGNWPSQAVAITMVDSQLDKLARKECWLNTFDMPDWVGGRTSITSAVGLLPAAFVGADIKKFLSGASLMDNLTRNHDFLENPASLLALAWWKSGEGKGSRDMVILPYRDRLEVFSRYLQQLVMESLGKRLDRNGKLVNQGLSVYGNKGSTDQHAYVQQLRDGLDNYFATFIEVLTDDEEIKTINNRNPGDFLSGFMQGTRTALTEAGKQSVTITISKFDTTSLGALIALFERAVSLYAELININAYHQPGVEAGKKAASNILGLKEEIIDLLSDRVSRSISEINDLTSGDNSESIYFILRHHLANNMNYNVKGNWSKPDTLRFKLN
ncbi:glucose-6-phosphate isomerase [Prochlorococcus sp. MIT 1307]|uniref:glucose-6-phosphate isomerase n=1 Tax=Prochlorococcus sp. MIT 1307 TaxID=3096219 RepID=UPI002A756A34|nr:glucose-6-phosphate isomerase [Prochlorococcus sp. MIT 1307]